jgi:hypothetical protein
MTLNFSWRMRMKKPTNEQIALLAEQGDACEDKDCPICRAMQALLAHYRSLIAEHAAVDAILAILYDWDTDVASEADAIDALDAAHEAAQ